MPPQPKFDFYERVRIESTDLRKRNLNGELGTVLGRAETIEHPDPFGYTVFIDSRELTHYMYESEMVSIGEFSSREEFDSGESIRVRVDENGYGEIVPPGEDET